MVDGRDEVPDAADEGDDAPDIEGADWLLAQLRGDRPTPPPAEAPAPPDAVAPVAEPVDAPDAPYFQAPPVFIPPPEPVPTSTGGWTLTDSGMIPEVASAPEPEPESDPDVAPAPFAWNLRPSPVEPFHGTEVPRAEADPPLPSSTRRSETTPTEADAPTELLATPAPSEPAGEGFTAQSRPSRKGGPSARNTRILIGVAIGLVALLVLLGLFVLGTRLPAMFAAPVPTPTHSAKPTPTPTPTPTVMPKPTVAQGPGLHEWNTLGGGECLQPYTTPWSADFTVVDCATPHAGQLTYTNLLSSDPAAAYPGADALAAQITLLCTKPGIVDLTAAAAYPDLQLQGSYPATAAQWAGGDRSYYCFVSRSSGQPITGSVAGPGPAS